MCLQASELSLTQKDINLLMGHVDSDSNGLVNYAEFVPLCFSLLVERFTDQVLHSSLLASADQLQNYILHCFCHFDTAGVLPCPAMPPCIASQLTSCRTRSVCHLDTAGVHVLPLPAVPCSEPRPQYGVSAGVKRSGKHEPKPLPCAKSKKFVQAGVSSCRKWQKPFPCLERTRSACAGKGELSPQMANRSHVQKDKRVCRQGRALAADGQK